MGNRYGRNQKRKARALLESVKAQSAMQRRLSESQAKSLELKLEKVAAGYGIILELIQNTLGPNALMRVLTTGKKTVITSGRIYPDGAPHQAFAPPKPFDPSAPFDPDEMVDVHQLYDLICHFSGSFETQMVANVKYRSGFVCMALNEAAFRAYPDYTMVSKISNDLLKHLRKQI